MSTPAGRLLILDDDAIVGQTIAAIARSVRLEAYCTMDAAAFFEALASWMPTHIALDLMMPDVDGIEIIRRLVELNCPAAIIITSGAGHRVLEAAHRSAREHGLNVAGIVSKPFTPNDLRPLLLAATPVIGPTRNAPAEQVAPPPPLAADLEAALRNGELDVHFQPKLWCQSGDLAGFEALARWHSPVHGHVPPDTFIILAEQSGLIGMLTDFVFEKSISWLAQLPLLNVTMSVNLSARSLNDLDLASHLAERCLKHRIDPVQVILELTETSAMTDPLASLDLLTRLRLKRFHLSIDDFGVGYSSLVQLARLPFSELKIDRTFVATARVSEESRAIIRAIISLGHSLGLRLTAEGVEDEETLLWLHQAGCDQAQGYHLGRPLPAADAKAWIAARR